MRSSAEGVLTCTPSESLEDIIPRLDKVTGMPVLGPDGKVIGVISRKVRRGEGRRDDEIVVGVDSSRGGRVLAM